jgi:hypothetical protein
MHGEVYGYFTALAREISDLVVDDPELTEVAFERMKGLRDEMQQEAAKTSVSAKKAVLGSGIVSCNLPLDTRRSNKREKTLGKF